MIAHAVLFDRLIARDEELRHLVDLRARSASSVAGFGVSVTGEAGIGKSRLLTEFERAIAAERGVSIRVSCEEISGAYAPLIAILDALSNRRELKRDTVHEIADLRKRLSTPAAADLASESARKHNAYRRLVSVLDVSARRLGQLTLVIDDLHWSDLSTLEALRLLARECAAHPLLIVLAYRPSELVDDHARALVVTTIEREGFDRITLERLSAGDVTEFLREMLPDIGPSARRRILALSEGRPFVIEELARSLIDRGSSAKLESTLSLRGAILDRVARLSPEHRAVIERAAVLGRDFSLEDVSAFGVSMQDLGDAMRAGVGLQILEERSVDRGARFRFRHELTRAIVYHEIPTILRNELHVRIADRIARSDDRLVEFAYHVSEGGDVARAGDANERAGDRAAGVLAFADAARLYARAFEFVSEAETLGRVGLKSVSALERAGDSDALLLQGPTVADRVRDRGGSDDALRIFIVTLRGVSRFHYAESLALLDRATELVDSATPADVAFDYELNKAMILRFNSRYSESLEACTRAEARVDSLNEHQRSGVLHQRALCAYFLGDVAGARDMLEERAAAQRGSLTLQETWTIAALGHVNRSLGKPREAFEYFVQAAGLCDRLGFYQDAAINACNAAGIAAERGDFAYATSVARQLRRDGTPQFYFLDVALLRVTRATGGDIAPFLAMFDRACDTGPAFLVTALAANLAYMTGDDRDAARDIVRRAFTFCAHLPEEVFALVVAIIDFGSEEDIARALDSYRSVTVDPHDTGLQLDAALIEASMASREHRPIEARNRARQAIELAERSEDWLSLMKACEIAQDIEGARAALLRVGATSELERLERRRGGVSFREPAATIKLTAREEQITRAYVAGHSSRDVARLLAITARTVETHLMKVYQKLGINSRSELAAWLSDVESTKRNR